MQKSIDDIAARLHQAIIKSEYKNISQLARHLDVDRRTVDNWVKGITCPTTIHIAKLCTLLKITPNWLIFGEEEASCHM